jgi:hypothetical protein
MKWQTGAYAPQAHLDLLYPQSFLLLCKLAEVPPEQLITDFIDNLACSNWNRAGRDQAKSKLIDYFIDHGYGQDYYTAEDLRAIFTEMDAVGMVWPAEGKMKLVELSSRWRNKYYKYWFRKWHRKPRRK